MTTDVQERTNGHHPRGRAAPPYPEFTFPDSGITVNVPRLSPDTQAQIGRVVREEMKQTDPEPQIPMEPVEGLDGKLAEEPNPLNEAYQTAQTAWYTRYYAAIGKRFSDLVLRQVQVEVDADAVQRLREDMAAIRTPIPDDEDDRTVYLRRICISSWVDHEALMAFVQRRNQPTKEAIQAYLDTFPHNV